MSNNIHVLTHIFFFTSYVKVICITGILRYCSGVITLLLLPGSPQQRKLVPLSALLWGRLSHRREHCCQWASKNICCCQLKRWMESPWSLVLEHSWTQTVCSLVWSKGWQGEDLAGCEPLPKERWVWIGVSKCKWETLVSTCRVSQRWVAVQ